MVYLICSDNYGTGDKNMGVFSFHKKNVQKRIEFDPNSQYAVIRSSICTGEKVAGFKNKTDGHFVDVMVIQSPEDEEYFKELYGIDKIKTEY